MVFASPEALEQRRIIDEARKLLAPREVKLGHVPNWFRKALLREYGCDAWRFRDGHSVLRHAFGHIGNRWLDHWGSSKLADGRVAFVSEPYGLSVESHQHIIEVAKRIGCEYRISPNSWWYPGATTRIEFFERTNDTPHE